MNAQEPQLAPRAQLLISNYLDALQLRLIVPPARQRRILEETEDHLYEAALAAMAEGAESSAAAQRAIDEFGAPADVASRFRPGLMQSVATLFEPEVAATIARGGFFLGGITLVAIGISGLLAQVFGWLWGEAFVAADINGVTYTAERCAQFEALVPDAKSCEQAAMLHHFGESVDGRLTFGILGLLVCLGYALWSRRSPRPGPPSLFVGAIGVSGFGIAALVLAASAANPIIQGVDGAGASLSAFLVAAVMALAFLPSLGRGLRTARATS